MHMVAVNSNHCDGSVRAFGTFTHDLQDIAAWLKTCGVTSVAIESTGVYWIPAYEVREQHGLEVVTTISKSLVFSDAQCSFSLGLMMRLT